MSVLIQKKDLLEAMQKAFPVVPSKSSLMILSNFKLSYVDSVLEVVATDAEHSLRVIAGASGDGPLDITVNARKTFEVVRELPDGFVTMSLDEMALIIESEMGFRCKIAGADSSDFPGIPTISDGLEMTIGSSAFREMTRKSSFAASTDESRVSLCGILWELSPDKTGMVATDGHRLGYSFVEMNMQINDSFNRIVSRKTMDMITRITDSKQDESLKVIIGEKYISFSTPSFTMVSKLIDGQYPEYAKVIPKNNPKVIVADRVGLLEAVRRVSVLSNQKNRLIRLTFRLGETEIMVMNREIGSEAREIVKVEYMGDEHVMGFNGQYLTEILSVMSAPKVRFEVGTQIGACLILPKYADEKDNVSEDLFLLMPLRIVDDM